MYLPTSGFGTSVLLVLPTYFDQGSAEVAFFITSLTASCCLPFATFLSSVRSRVLVSEYVAD